jgi:hypothetical protein
MAGSTPHDERSEAAGGNETTGGEPASAAPGPARGGPEPGAPIAHDQIDPELVKLSRPRPRVGVITAAGLVFLSIAFLWRLGPDRRFAGNTEPRAVQLADVLAGKVDTDELVALTAEPLISRAIRATKAKGSLGFRVVPVRGAGDRLWLAVSGDGWEPPATSGYVGRLRRLDDLPFAVATRAHAAEHPRPVFASPAAVRAGFASGSVATVAGDTVALTERDTVATEMIDPGACTIAASFNERLPDTAAWLAALSRAGVVPTSTGAPDAAVGQVRFQVAASVTATTTKLETAGLWAARVEPVTRRYETQWGALRTSSPAGLTFGTTTLPDPQLELVGLYVARPIPDDAYALVTGESPEDYWYVMPITVALAAILLVFAWALVRAIRRDVLPARPPET